MSITGIGRAAALALTAAVLALGLTACKGTGTTVDPVRAGTVAGHSRAWLCFSGRCRWHRKLTVRAGHRRTMIAVTRAVWDACPVGSRYPGCRDRAGRSG